MNYQQQARQILRANLNTIAAQLLPYSIFIVLLTALLGWMLYAIWNFAHQVR